MSRVAGLPRRQWEDSVSDGDIRALTDLLRTPAGVETLRKMQAVGLLEASQCGGLFAMIEVGGGKTHLSALIPTVLEAKRPLLLVPGSKKADTRDWIDRLRQHWQILSFIRVESYNKLSDPNHADLLERFLPDLIILDEAHLVKSVATSARARRLARFFASHPECKCCAMSGSFGAELTDYAHILDWCLRDQSPVPRIRVEQSQWAKALGSEECDYEDLERLESGLGVQIISQDQARIAFRERLISTPGVLVSMSGFEGSELVVRPRYLEPDPKVDPLFEDLRNLWEAPDGWLLADAQFEVWATARKMQLGFYHRHDPRPPEDWYDARRAYCGFVRSMIQMSDIYDTEKQIRTAFEDGHIKSRVWDEWVEIQPTFEPNTVTDWLSSNGLEFCLDWGERHGGIIWCEFTEFAKVLAEISGWKYFGSHGLCSKTGEFIETSKDRTIIASVNANFTGRNLQTWHSNLIVAPHPSQEMWEQLMGRTHRSGQKAKRVTVDYLVSGYESFAAIFKAIERSRRTIYEQNKLLTCDVQTPRLKFSGPAWVP